MTNKEAEAAANVATADKPDKGLWMFDKEITGGKYIVLRRDGTVFGEPNFVLGPRDPAAPDTMRYYAQLCKVHNVGNPQYRMDCVRLADAMDAERERLGAGDAGKGPHRLDHPKVVAQMLQPSRRILAPLPTDISDAHRSAARRILHGHGLMDRPALFSELVAAFAEFDASAK